MTALRTIDINSPAGPAQLDELIELLKAGGLTNADAEDALDVPVIVAGILEDVRLGGDEAAARLTSQFDGAAITPATLRVPAERIARAHADAEPAFLELMRSAIANIRAYQEHILVKAPPPLERGGRKLGVRYTPIERTAVYVPGGQALYPSTVLMTVVPAQVAGVREIVMLTPPTGGEINDMALALAGELGIEEVYRVGGAVAVAAVAYGTESIRAVDKIVGPGNAFVAEAKRQLFGRVGIDSIAGPSEVVIVADDSAPADWVAADLLAQAEHNPGSSVLVTPNASLASEVEKALDAGLAELERADVIRPALEAYGAIVLVEDLEQACAIANRFAPEHLQIMTRDDEACTAAIPNAGAVFTGRYTPVPLGDYFAGPSHVLPTGTTARFFGPLSCNDFVKASSLLEYDAASMTEDADAVSDFATREGLTAHARAARLRKRD
ncbi:MAG: histidinol dehydrogenase [Myxococcota bacterium]|jgi:histidinol dehydrogenase|nr:histidinol dehydrogenase [Myxococcota bacterium]